MKNRKGKVVCVDLLELAIEKLQSYSQKFGVEPFIETRLSDIEPFIIDQEEYDIILAVSALEHVSSEKELKRKLHEMIVGTKPNGANCIIIGSNIQEVDLENGQQLDPMFEVNISEADDIVKEVDLKIEKSKIYRNLDILDDREKEVVVGRFGLDTGGEERTQREIAKELGISRSYVSRIEKRALMKLYHEFYKVKR
jgi:RNA polymerase sigma factor (sigma-70 family)